jgi:hypothetical protein
VPYSIHLVDDVSGGYTDISLPAIYLLGEAYYPQAVVSNKGTTVGLRVSYAPEDAAQNYLVVLELDLEAGITGIDDYGNSVTSRWTGELVTGEFRLEALGLRGQLNEVLVRTWADPDATSRPDLVVMMREESDEQWRAGDQSEGTITVGTSSCVGTGTAWSRILADGDDVEDTFDIPWLVESIKGVYRLTAGPVYTAASYTKTGAKQIQLDSALATGEQLYVDPGVARPFVRMAVSDYIETEEGFHRVATVQDAYNLTLDWYPSQERSGVHVPAQQIPVGGDEGDGRLVFGLGKGFDGLMLRILLIPRDSSDAVGAKITGLELGYTPSGKEMKTDD